MSIARLAHFYYIKDMALKRFSIGVQDFARLRNDGMYYVDKTDLVYKLTHTDPYYFLSRPRRFGKSLLVSTLQYYFEGRKDFLFNRRKQRHSRDERWEHRLGAPSHKGLHERSSVRCRIAERVALQDNRLLRI